MAPHCQIACPCHLTCIQDGSERSDARQKPTWFGEIELIQPGRHFLPLLVWQGFDQFVEPAHAIDRVRGEQEFSLAGSLVDSDQGDLCIRNCPPLQARHGDLIGIRPRFLGGQISSVEHFLEAGGGFATDASSHRFGNLTEQPV